MQSKQDEPRLWARLWLILLVSAFAPCAAINAHAAQPLSLNDVTWLFPPPATEADLDSLISVANLTVQPTAATAPQALWSDADFGDFLAVTDSQTATVEGTGDRPTMPPEARDRRNWFVAGVRIDPGAPSLAPEVVQVFGRRPQIRLVLQPVRRDSLPGVDDIAAHLIFDFVNPPTRQELAACPLHATPDDVAFTNVVAGVVDLRDRLASGDFGAAVTTAGQPLDVHPGLARAESRTNLTAAMKQFLEANLARARLSAMAVMSIPAGGPAPWMFLSMNRGADGHFIAIASPTLSGSQFTMEFQSSGAVLPVPHTNNLNPITCLNAAFGQELPPIAQRQGVATADVMASPGMTAQAKMDIFDRLANTSQSHFFNTDCVSCHTATQMQMTLSLAVPGIATGSVQNGPYNVRDLGWSVERTPSPPSIARRTQAESADSVAWINAHLPP
jgi:hypothetical protein